MLAGLAMARVRLSARSLVWGALALAAWALFAALAPTALGIDHRGLLSIVGAGDQTALHKGFGTYPLRALVPIAALAGVLTLLLARLMRHEDGASPAAGGHGRDAPSTA